MEDFGTIALNALLAAATLAVPVVVRALWSWTSQLAQGIENEFLSTLTMRVIMTVDDVTGAAFGRFDELTAAAQLAESDGGPKITADEWKGILDELFEDFKAGFGQDWLSRAAALFGSAEAFEAQVKSKLEARLVSSLDEKRIANAEKKERLA